MDLKLYQAIDIAGSEIFTLHKYLEDPEMEVLHGVRFRKMIKSLTILITYARENPYLTEPINGGSE